MERRPATARSAVRYRPSKLWLIVLTFSVTNDIVWFVTPPLVIGFTPIIGPGGGVGGVDVDAKGVLSRVETPRSTRLDEARSKALLGISENLRRSSPIRKVSLRQLEAEIAKHAANQEPLGSDILYLAGLQRIQYVFAYPETRDIVVAGPAEGWVLQGRDVVGCLQR